MLHIHEFWVELFPMFQNSYEFIYVFFDFATILALLTIFFEVPAAILLGKKGRGGIGL